MGSRGCQISVARFKLASKADRNLYRHAIDEAASSCDLAAAGFRLAVRPARCYSLANDDRCGGTEKADRRVELVDPPTDLEISHARRRQLHAESIRSASVQHRRSRDL